MLPVERQLLRSLASLVAVLLLPRSSPPVIVERSTVNSIECSCRPSELARAEGDLLVCRGELDRKWNLLEVFLVVILAVLAGAVLGWFLRGPVVTPLAVPVPQNGAEEERARAENRRRGGGVLRGREGVLALRG